VSEVLRYLRRWADESDLAEPLRPYAVLADLSVCRGEYRVAAEAQVAAPNSRLATYRYK
jgi:hypothetical protein